MHKAAWVLYQASKAQAALLMDQLQCLALEINQTCKVILMLEESAVVILLQGDRVQALYPTL